ncbi:MAG: energy transducer TonB [Thermoanaerobaculum sp.]
MSSNERRNEDLTLHELASLALEYEQDRRILRVATAIAVAFHIVLFIIRFPEWTTRTAQAQQNKPKIFVVQQPRFKPPEVQKQEQILKPRTVRVPIPDPTPDEPEPVRQYEPEEEIPETPIPAEAVFGEIGPPPAPEDEGPIRVGGQIQMPRKIKDVQPVYTEVARRARIEGVVILEIIIDKQGNVKDVKVLRALPMGLTEAAVEAVKQWKYEPSKLNGKPIEIQGTVTVTFRLQ